MSDQNTFLPLLDLATPVSKPKQRRSFWYKNRRAIDRIGAKGKYASSSSSSSSDNSTTATSSSNSETSSTTNTDTEASTNNPGTRCTRTFCICQNILRRPHHTLLSDPDLRTQMLTEVYNWLNGGYHVCAFPTTISIPCEEFTPSPFGSGYAYALPVMADVPIVSASITHSGAENGSGSGQGSNESNKQDGGKFVLTEQERDEYYATVTPDEYWRGVYEVAGPEEGATISDKVAMTEQQRDDYLYRTVVSADYWTEVYLAGDREASGLEKDGSNDDGGDEEEEMKQVKEEEETTDTEEKKEVKKLQDYSHVLMAALLGLLVGRSTADSRVLFFILGIFTTECLFRSAYLKYKQARRTETERK